MAKAVERLRRSTDFERAYREGKRLVNPFFVAFVRVTTEGRPRVAFVASRRVGSAVERNRAKRLLREAFRRSTPAEGASVDVVLVARKGMKHAGYREVEAAYHRGVGRFLEKVFGSPR